MEGVLGTLKGQIVEVLDKPNINGRIYTKECIENSVLNNPLIQERLKLHCLFGIFNLNGNEEVTLNNTSHCVTNLYIEDNCLKADIDILDTPNGRMLKEHLDKGEGIYPYLSGNGELELVGYYRVSKYELDNISISALSVKGIEQKEK